MSTPRRFGGYKERCKKYWREWLLEIKGKSGLPLYMLETFVKREKQKIKPLLKKK